MRRERTEDSAGECCVECGGGCFAADVSYSEGYASGTVVEIVVDVATDGPGGDELRGYFGAF